MNQDQLEELKIKLVEIKFTSQIIRDNNFTRKTTGGKYAIRKGYPTAVRRPFRDLLKWMNTVEAMLEIILEEAENAVKQ